MKIPVRYGLFLDGGRLILLTRADVGYGVRPGAKIFLYYPAYGRFHEGLEVPDQLKNRSARHGIGNNNKKNHSLLRTKAVVGAVPTRNIYWWYVTRRIYRAVKYYRDALYNMPLIRCAYSVRMVKT